MLLPHREERAVRDPVGPALAHRHDRHRLESRQGAPGRDRGRHRLPARARERGARRCRSPARTSRASTPGCGRCSPARATRPRSSRREHIVAHTVPGLVVVAGGKWTTYRIMAKDAIDAAADALDGKVPPSTTQDIPLLGAEGYQAAWNKRGKIARAFGVHKVRIEHLLNRYGTMTDELLDLIRADPRSASRCPAPTTTSAPRSSTRRRTRARCTSTTCSPGAPASRSRRGTAASPPRPSPRSSWAACSGWDEAREALEVERYLQRVAAERAVAGAARRRVGRPRAARGARHREGRLIRRG